MDKQIKKFISLATIDLLKNHITIKLENTANVTFKEGDVDVCVSGFFDETNSIFCCATGKAQHEWFPVFVHEYCHFRQWMEHDYKYKELMKYDAERKFEYWINNKLELSQKNISLIIDLIKDIELDCEKRVVQYIDKYKLPINKDEYIRAANAYILSYNILKITRKWYAYAPFCMSKIYKHLPNHFLNCYNRTPKKFKQMVLSECYEN